MALAGEFLWTKATLKRFGSVIRAMISWLVGWKDMAMTMTYFFSRYDQYRFSTESHILSCLDDIDFNGKQTLEMGLGRGADAEQIIRRGAIWSGIDLTQESIRRVRARLTLRNLPYRKLKQGSVLALPFEDNNFDIVLSHGVLHHVPDIDRAQREIHRVLQPRGELIVMLYAKWSLNYLLSIFVWRRLGLIALYLSGKDLGGKYSQHLANARQNGLMRYLRMQNFIHKNTDGPLNPYSKVYDRRTLRDDFSMFEWCACISASCTPLRFGSVGCRWNACSDGICGHT